MKASPARSAVRGLRIVSAALMVVSVGINVLMLASPLYMMQVFDRVLTGRSVETLVFLSIAVATALLVMGGLDAVRSVVWARFGDWMENRLNGPLLRASLDLSSKPQAGASDQPLADLGSVRQFLASAGPAAMFDAPLMPIFVAVIWLIEPTLGMIAVASALLLAGMALATELLTRKITHAATVSSADSQPLLSGTLANAELARTMGLASGIVGRWRGMRDDTSALLLASASRLGVLGTASKALRLAIQAAILGTGAYLVIQRKITPGEMIACSIILARALAPIETAIGTWRGFVSARQSWRRMMNLLTMHEARPKGLALPAPKGALSFDKVVLAGEQGAEPLLRNISFAIPAGATLGVIGTSGSGKSCLARLMVRAWEPGSGSVRLDGADLRQWDVDALGQFVGYLPQNPELFHGTVRDNIARFSDVPLGKVVTAADRAGAHEMILGLPDGYNTQVGARGTRLSGGQRQRVALARAIFGEPCLVVLDEPDASLDQVGMEALERCIARLKSEGRTVVIAAHRQRALAQCDWLLMLEAGQMKAFGPAAKVTEQLKLRAAGAARLRAVGGDEAKSQ